VVDCGPDCSAMMQFAQRTTWNSLLQGVLINYLSTLIFVLLACFMRILFVVLCYVVLFLLSATLLLSQYVNKQELNSIEFNYYINMFSSKHLFFLQAVIRVVVASKKNSVKYKKAL
jgi:hypothetical protein